MAIVVRSPRAKLAILTLLVMCLAGCGRGGTQEDAAKAQEDAKTKLESMQQAAAQTAQTYKAMDNDALLQKLTQQSAARREPFNSLAYRELTGRKDVNPETLASLVRSANNGNGLLPLLLLRKLNKEAYLDMPAELRAAVLTDALRTSKMFNTWGLPHLYLEDASEAMLETGSVAAPALKQLLSDTRPAPMFGGREFMEFQRYKYRLCDYALFFLEKIQGNTGFVMPVAPSDRDVLIRGLQ
jgi:hypothetical protein